MHVRPSDYRHEGTGGVEETLSSFEQAARQAYSPTTYHTCFPLRGKRKIRHGQRESFRSNAAPV